MKILTLSVLVVAAFVGGRYSASTAEPHSREALLAGLKARMDAIAPHLPAGEIPKLTEADLANAGAKLHEASAFFKNELAPQLQQMPSELAKAQALFEANEGLLRGLPNHKPAGRLPIAP